MLRPTVTKKKNQQVPPVGLYDLRNKINQNKNNKIKNQHD